MGALLFDDKSQKIANWICSDTKKNIPIYINLCNEVLKKDNIKITNDSFLLQHVSHKTICFYSDDKLLIGFLTPTLRFDELFITDEDGNQRNRNQKELQELWSQGDNYNLPTMFEGYLHQLNVKDTLLNYDYIMSHMRDLKLNQLLHD